MNFQTKMNPSDVSIYGLGDLLPDLPANGNYDTENKDFTVFWSVEIEARDWGVKDISWFVTDVKGTFDVVCYDENGDDVGNPKRVDFNFDELFRESTSMDLELDEFRQIQVSDLEIDYSTHTVTVN